MRKIFLSGWVVIFLAACAPSQSAIQTAMAKTQISLPTSTLVPFSSLQLDNQLIQPNDLPSGVTGAQISYNETLNSRVVPADYYIEQDLAYKDNKRGSIQVWVYGSDSDRDAKYQTLLAELRLECLKSAHQCHPGEPLPLSDVGEAAQEIDVYNLIGFDNYTIVFYRCHAAFEVNIWAAINGIDGLVTYSERLDKRLTPIICR